MLEKPSINISLTLLKFIDPVLQKDASFWDYAVLARESGGNQLRIFGEEGKSCEEELREWGGKEEVREGLLKWRREIAERCEGFLTPHLLIPAPS